MINKKAEGLQSPPTMDNITHRNAEMEESPVVRKRTDNNILVEDGHSPNEFKMIKRDTHRRLTQGKQEVP